MMKQAEAASNLPASGQADITEEKRSAQKFWQRYFSFYDTLNEALPYRRMIERQVELLAPAPAELILDAGTGTGNVAVELLARGARVIGIDFCEPALAQCRLKAPRGDFRFGDLTQRLDFESDCFDKIACSCVLHVLDRPAQEFAVRELFRVLKPGGTVVVTAFASGFNSLKVYAETLREQRRASSLAEAIWFGIRYSISTARILYYVWRIKRREKSGDYHFFTRAEFMATFNQAGFEVTSIESVFASQCLAGLARKPLATTPG